MASDNWREPVIVRGLFADVAAVSKWPAPGGLEPLADFKVRPALPLAAATGPSSGACALPAPPCPPLSPLFAPPR